MIFNSRCPKNKEKQPCKYQNCNTNQLNTHQLQEKYYAPSGFTYIMREPTYELACTCEGG